MASDTRYTGAPPRASSIPTTPPLTDFRISGCGVALHDPRPLLEQAHAVAAVIGISAEAESGSYNEAIIARAASAIETLLCLASYALSRLEDDHAARVAGRL